MKNWVFIQNPILHTTENSFRNALRISTYHHSALAASKDDSFFNDLYSKYNLVHLAFKNAYEKWVSQFGNQQGETLNMLQLIKKLASTKIKQWDIKIQNIYPQNTPAYKRLLPNRRIPFQSGTQEDRKNAVKALSEALTGDTDLSDLKADIDTYYQMLDGSLSNQKSSKSMTKTFSDDLESKRVAMSIMQYSHIGFLIYKFAAEPEKIKKYFDLEAIRNGQQFLYTRHIKPDTKLTVFKHTFTAAELIKIENHGTTGLSFYLSAVKEAKPDSVHLDLEPGNMQTVGVDKLGNLADSYLIAYNPDTNYKGEFSIQLV